jgi:hypothetical protein
LGLCSLQSDQSEYSLRTSEAQVQRFFSCSCSPFCELGFGLSDGNHFPLDQAKTQMLVSDA